MTLKLCYALISTVARLAGSTHAALMRGGRARWAVTARHVALWLLRHCFGLSYPESARALQLRDHTSAINACRRVDDEIRAGKGWRLDLLVETIGALA